MKTNRVDLSSQPRDGITIVTSDSWLTFEDLKAKVSEWNHTYDNETIEFALSYHRDREEKYGLLFINLNDKESQVLYEKILNEYDPEKYFPIYIIDTFECPEIFLSFSVKKAPTLITSFVKFFITEDYLPIIYSKLGL